MKKLLLIVAALCLMNTGWAAQGGTMELVITKENFQKEVLESKLPVLVDFFAIWCGPCKMLSPVVAEFAEENVGKIVVGKCDIDAQPELANEFKIEVVPTLIAFKNGTPVMGIKGLCGKKDLQKLFE